MRRRRIALGLTSVLTVLLIGASIYAWTRVDAGAQSHANQVEQTERGRALFISKGCAACHHVAEKGLVIVMGSGPGPDLSSLPEMAATRVEGQSAEDYVRVSILNPDAYIAPNYGNVTFGMPQIPVTEPELDALVAFLLDDG